MNKLIPGLFLFLWSASLLNADFFQFAQQIGQVESLSGDSNGTRAIYLGRLLFAEPAPPTVFTGVVALATLREANNVQLWVGNGTTYSGAASRFDTGIRFTQPSQTENVSVWSSNKIPGSSGFVMPQNLNFATGLAIRDLYAATSGNLDFWLVGNGNFSAPSGTVGNPPSSFPFAVQLGITAVPEPSSLMLSSMALLGGAYMFTRNRKAKREQ